MEVAKLIWIFLNIAVFIDVVLGNECYQTDRYKEQINNFRSTENDVVVTNNENVCSTWSNGYVNTFDGHFYSARGNCTYILSQHCHVSNPDFVIIFKRDTDNADLVYITLNLFGDLVNMNKTVVEVNGKGIDIPYSSSNMDIYAQGLDIVFSSHNIEVYVDMLYAIIQVQLPEKYINKTCGLCGDYNGFKYYNEGFKEDDPDSINEILEEYMVDIPGEYCVHSSAPLKPICNYVNNTCKQILESAALANCTAHFNMIPYLEMCEMDSCNCNTSDSMILACICSTLSEFSKQCAHAELYTGNWRNPEVCEIICQPPMEYNECGSACERTCSNQEPRSCIKKCVGGCFCPNGTLYDDVGNKGCILPSECLCKYLGSTYPTDAQLNLPCENCTCYQGTWKCTSKSCPGSCSVEGGSHITTFDKRRYTFHGECTYILTQLCNAVSFFSVHGEIKSCKANEFETCLTKIILVIKNPSIVLVINSNGDITLNSVAIQLPYVDGNLIVFMPTTFYVIVKTSFDLQLELQFKPIMQAYIYLEPSYFGLTCGLCGNFNDKQVDDYILPNGLTVQDISTFTYAWRSEQTCPNVPTIVIDPCSINIQKEAYASMWCSKINSEEIFAKCRELVDPAVYYQNCLYDTCLCKHSEDCMCALFSSFVRACTEHGIIIDDWREHICTRYIKNCDPPMVYREIVNTCQLTCKSLGEPDQSCTVDFVDIDGCVCNIGMYMTQYGECVILGECPCFHRGTYYSPGEKVFSNGVECVCHNGKLRCDYSKLQTKNCTLPMVYFNCSEEPSGSQGIECLKSCQNLDVDCYSTECISGCVCPQGMLTGGNGGCVLEGQCTCFHDDLIYNHNEQANIGCNNCTCNNRKWDCPVDGVMADCSIYGEGNFITFDKRRYRFNGPCKYTLVQDYCGSNVDNGTFRIIFENTQCSDTGTTCAKTITVTYEDSTIQLSDGEVQVISEGAEIDSQFQLKNNSLFLSIDFKNGLGLIWDKNTALTVKIPLTFQHKVCGMCGNYDGNSNNDFTTRSQLSVEDVIEFGNSWKLPPTCPDADSMIEPCDINHHRKSWAQRQCGIMLGPTFKPCHSEVDPTGYYEACVKDSCACDEGGDCECYCTAIAMYALECLSHCICIDWRTPGRCPVFCDYYNEEGKCEWHYKACGANCMQTCRNPSGNCSTEPVKIEGCYPRCPEDSPYYEEVTMKCVSQCGCYDHMGHYYMIGEKIISCNNCEVCNCTTKGIVCHYDIDACYCEYNGSIYAYNQTISVTDIGKGMCIVLVCGINGTTTTYTIPCGTATSTVTQTSTVTITSQSTSTTVTPPTTTKCFCYFNNKTYSPDTLIYINYNGSTGCGSQVICDHFCQIRSFPLPCTTTPTTSTTLTSVTTTPITTTLSTSLTSTSTVTTKTTTPSTSTKITSRSTSTATTTKPTTSVSTKPTSSTARTTSVKTSTSSATTKTTTPSTTLTSTTTTVTPTTPTSTSTTTIPSTSTKTTTSSTSSTTPTTTKLSTTSVTTKLSTTSTTRSTATSTTTKLISTVTSTPRTTTATSTIVTSTPRTTTTSTTVTSTPKTTTPTSTTITSTPITTTTTSTTVTSTPITTTTSTTVTSTPKTTTPTSATVTSTPRTSKPTSTTKKSTPRTTTTSTTVTSTPKTTTPTSTTVTSTPITTTTGTTVTSTPITTTTSTTLTSTPKTTAPTSTTVTSTPITTTTTGTTVTSTPITTTTSTTVTSTPKTTAPTSTTVTSTPVTTTTTGTTVTSTPITTTTSTSVTSTPKTTTPTSTTVTSTPITTTTTGTTVTSTLLTTTTSTTVTSTPKTTTPTSTTVTSTPITKTTSTTVTSTPITTTTSTTVTSTPITTTSTTVTSTPKTTTPTSATVTSTPRTSKTTSTTKKSTPRTTTTRTTVTSTPITTTPSTTVTSTPKTTTPTSTTVTSTPITTTTSTTVTSTPITTATSTTVTSTPKTTTPTSTTVTSTPITTTTSTTVTSTPITTATSTTITSTPKTSTPTSATVTSTPITTTTSTTVTSTPITTATSTTVTSTPKTTIPTSTTATTTPITTTTTSTTVTSTPITTTTSTTVTSTPKTTTPTSPTVTSTPRTSKTTSTTKKSTPRTTTTSTTVTSTPKTTTPTSTTVTSTPLTTASTTVTSTPITTTTSTTVTSTPKTTTPTSTTVTSTPITTTSTTVTSTPITTTTSTTVTSTPKTTTPTSTTVTSTPITTTTSTTVTSTPITTATSTTVTSTPKTTPTSATVTSTTGTSKPTSTTKKSTPRTTTATSTTVTSTPKTTTPTSTTVTSTPITTTTTVTSTPITTTTSTTVTSTPKTTTPTSTTVTSTPITTTTTGTTVTSTPITTTTSTTVTSTPKTTTPTSTTVTSTPITTTTTGTTVTSTPITTTTSTTVTSTPKTTTPTSTTVTSTPITTITTGTTVTSTPITTTTSTTVTSTPKTTTPTSTTVTSTPITTTTTGTTVTSTPITTTTSTTVTSTPKTTTPTSTTVTSTPITTTTTGTTVTSTPITTTTSTTVTSTPKTTTPTSTTVTSTPITTTTTGTTVTSTPITTTTSTTVTSTPKTTAPTSTTVTSTPITTTTTGTTVTSTPLTTTTSTTVTSTPKTTTSTSTTLTSTPRTTTPTSTTVTSTPITTTSTSTTVTSTPSTTTSTSTTVTSTPRTTTTTSTTLTSTPRTTTPTSTTVTSTPSTITPTSTTVTSTPRTTTTTSTTVTSTPRTSTQSSTTVSIANPTETTTTTAPTTSVTIPQCYAVSCPAGSMLNITELDCHNVSKPTDCNATIRVYDSKLCCFVYTCAYCYSAAGGVYKPDDTWTEDCQQCTCTINALKMCQPIPCLPTVTPNCDEPGYEVMKIENPDKPCCFKEICVCNTSLCDPIIKSCPHSFWPVITSNGCCITVTCVPEFTTTTIETGVTSTEPPTSTTAATITTESSTTTTTPQTTNTETTAETGHSSRQTLTTTTAATVTTESSATTTAPTTTNTETTTSAIPESTTPNCVPVCSWSPWIDVSFPTNFANGGENETFDIIRKKGIHVCEKPLNISCRSKSLPDTPLGLLDLNVICNIHFGLICSNKDQAGLLTICIDFQISIYCCEPLPDSCYSTATKATEETTSTTTSPTSAIVTGTSSTTTVTSVPTTATKSTEETTSTTTSPTTGPIGLCIYNDTVYSAGSIVPSPEECTHCICSSIMNTTTQLNIIICMPTVCNEKCAENEQYEIVPGECCGKCVPTACYVTTPSGETKVLMVDESWVPKNENCTIYKCVKEANGQLYISVTNQTCEHSSAEDCGPGQEYMPPSEGQCCGQCVQTHCVLSLGNGNIIDLAVGQSVSSPFDNCITYTCVMSGEQLVIIEEKQTCQVNSSEDCKVGEEYEPPTDQCCGKCVQRYCVMTTPNGETVLLSEGQSVSSPNDSCTTYKCVMSGEQLVLVEEKQTCQVNSSEDCKVGEDYVPPTDQCCGKCVQRYCVMTTPNGETVLLSEGESVSSPNDNCITYTCVMSEEQLVTVEEKQTCQVNSSDDCKVGEEYVPPTDQCCGKCVQRYCVMTTPNGETVLLNEGETVFSPNDNCTFYKCVKSEEQLVTVAEKVTCQVNSSEDCKVGEEYIPPTGQCCGECVQKHCVITTPNGETVLLNEGQSVSFPSDNCTYYQCVKSGEQLGIVEIKASCQVTSSEDCKISEEYVPPTDQCCGECVQRYCVMTTPNGETKLLNEGESVSSPNDNCTSYKCVMSGEQLVTVEEKVTCQVNSSADCKVDEEYFRPVNSCCGECVKKACVFVMPNGDLLLLNPGETMTDSNDICTNYTCKEVNGQLIAEIEKQKCKIQSAADCQPGENYNAPIDECCGKCVPKECIIVMPSGEIVVLKPGESSSSAKDKCVTYECIEVDGALYPMLHNKSCDNVKIEDCETGTIEVSDDGCCSKCKAPKPCGVEVGPVVLLTGECPLNLTIPYCSGVCTYPTMPNAMEPVCKCCQILQSRKESVEIACKNGTTVTYEYDFIENCGCHDPPCAYSTTPR